MSSYKNNVRLEGNLGKNAEKKTTPNGDVVNFSIAVNEEWKDKDGNEHKNTDSGLGAVDEDRRPPQGRNAGHR
jgi:single-stranded DNA-binding protein